MERKEFGRQQKLLQCYLKSNPTQGGYKKKWEKFGQYTLNLIQDQDKAKMIPKR